MTDLKVLLDKMQEVMSKAKKLDVPADRNWQYPPYTNLYGYYSTNLNDVNNSEPSILPPISNPDPKPIDLNL